MATGKFCQFSTSHALLPEGLSFSISEENVVPCLGYQLQIKDCPEQVSSLTVCLNHLAISVSAITSDLRCLPGHWKKMYAKNPNQKWSWCLSSHLLFMSTAAKIRWWVISHFLFSNFKLKNDFSFLTYKTEIKWPWCTQTQKALPACRNPNWFFVKTTKKPQKKHHSIYSSKIYCHDTQLCSK